MKEENLDEKVPVRAYTKADLAMLYNPGVCITTAHNFFAGGFMLTGN